MSNEVPYWHVETTGKFKATDVLPQRWLAATGLLRAGVSKPVHAVHR